MPAASARTWRANERYAEASDLDPEDAAEIYAAESMPEDPGAPGD